MRLRAVLVLIGFTAVIAQIVLMRELIVVFYGNEISLGLMLANWLLWTAVGSSLFGRLGGRMYRLKSGLPGTRPGATAHSLQPTAFGLMAALEAAIAIAFPLTIFAVRASRSAFQAVPGEILGPGPMFLTTLVTLGFFCVISGWLFAAGSRLYAAERGASTAAATGSVYLLEALGSGFGGILASLVLIRYLGAFEIALLVGLLNLMAAATLAIRARAYRRAVIGALVVVAILPAIPFGQARMPVTTWLEETSRARLWRGFELAATRNSLYGNLVVAETEGTRTLFENGLVVFNAPGLAAAEEAVHFALLEHPSPASLLLIGGGVNGSVAQALRHPGVQRIDYVELDPAILELAREYFPDEWSPIQADRRVRVHSADGRLFLKTTDSRFDVIIVNLPDPQTAQLNRFYTIEFFREAAGKLTAGGILSFRLTAAENYISPELGEFLRCINKTLRAVFPEVVMIPGDTVHFFAAARPGVLARDSQELLARLRARRIQTSYVREYYIPFRMMPDRVADLESQIHPRADTPVNRDFAPIAYYFDVALWSAQFNRGNGRLFQSLARVGFGRLVGAVALLLFALAGLMLRLPRKEQRPRANAGFCVAAMGFTLIGLEVLLLLAFQAIYGYVYHQLAILIAALMVGMALGSWWASRRSAECGMRSAEWRKLVWLQVAAAASPLVLCALFVLLARLGNPLALSLVSQAVFPALALLCGLLGGYQFPVASRIFFAPVATGIPARRGEEDGQECPSLRNPGILYGLDLMGACLGAVLLSAYLVPVFGFFKTAVLMALVNLAPAALAAVSVPEDSAGVSAKC